MVGTLLDTYQSLPNKPFANHIFPTRKSVDIAIIAMPLVGKGHSLDLVGDEAPYFTSLEELDAWMDKPSKRLRSVLPYTPRSTTGSTPTRGRLLVRPTKLQVVLGHQIGLLIQPRSATITR